ncbi:MAG: hypothetical protein COA79_25820 [Planctomycetota bacterium]|nr:MAG: hypothetical protein COA79_25820 [Planctomycetota bacterium]
MNRTTIFILLICISLNVCLTATKKDEKKLSVKKDNNEPEIQKEKSEKGKKYFSDDFSEKKIINWKLEKWEEGKKVELEIKKERLWMKTNSRLHGCMLWCKKELPKDFLFEFDFTPVSEGKGFFLIFFCYKDKDGKDILEEKAWKDRKYRTLFKKYVKGKYNGYHISFRRGASATCNFRKNAGMTLLKQHKLDKVLPKDKTYHVSLYKKGGHMILKVDDTVFMDYTDDGKENGKVREGGRIALRQVYDSEAFYDNIKITDLEKTDKKPLILKDKEKEIVDEKK